MASLDDFKNGVEDLGQAIKQGRLYQTPFYQDYAFNRQSDGNTRKFFDDKLVEVTLLLKELGETPDTLKQKIAQEYERIQTLQPVIKEAQEVLRDLPKADETAKAALKVRMDAIKEKLKPFGQLPTDINLDGRTSQNELARLPEDLKLMRTRPDIKMNAVENLKRVVADLDRDVAAFVPVAPKAETLKTPSPVKADTSKTPAPAELTSEQKVALDAFIKSVRPEMFAAKGDMGKVIGEMTQNPKAYWENVAQAAEDYIKKSGGELKELTRPLPYGEAPSRDFVTKFAAGGYALDEMHQIRSYARESVNHFPDNAKLENLTGPGQTAQVITAAPRSIDLGNPRSVLRAIFDGAKDPIVLMQGDAVIKHLDEQMKKGNPDPVAGTHQISPEQDALRRIGWLAHHADGYNKSKSLGDPKSYEQAGRDYMAQNPSQKDLWEIVSDLSGKIPDVRQREMQKAFIDLYLDRGRIKPDMDNKGDLAAVIQTASSHKDFAQKAGAYTQIAKCLFDGTYNPAAGIGSLNNPAMGIQLLKAAAEMRDPDAIVTLAEIAYTGKIGGKTLKELDVSERVMVQDKSLAHEMMDRLGVAYKFEQAVIPGTAYPRLLQEMKRDSSMNYQTPEGIENSKLTSPAALAGF